MDRGARFGDWCLEDEGPGREEFPDGVGNGKSFPFGLAGVLEAEVVHLSGCE